MVHCLTDGTWWSLVFAGILLLSGTVNRVSSRTYNSHSNDDDSDDEPGDGSDDDNFYLESGSGVSEVETLSTVAASAPLTEGFKDTNEPAGPTMMIAVVVGCAAFVIIVIIIAVVVAVVLVRKRKGLLHVSNGGKPSIRNTYEVRKPESRLQSDEGEHYTTPDNGVSSRPCVPVNDSPVYEDVKLA